MPTIRKTMNVDADVVYPLQGSQYEFLPFNASLAFAVVLKEALTANKPSVTADVFSGSDVLQQDGDVELGATTGTVRNPDDFLVTDIGAAGERISVALKPRSQGGGSGTTDVLTVVKIIPV